MTFPLKDLDQNDADMKDIRGHLVYSMLILFGFFKEGDDENSKKNIGEKFNTIFFLMKLSESEDYVDGFLNDKKGNEDYDLLLNIAGLSYAKKILNISSLPDECFDRSCLLNEIKLIIGVKLSKEERLQTLLSLTNRSGYKVLF